MANALLALAILANRDYITPEDVTSALSTTPVDTVRLDLLEVIGKQTDFSIEDAGLCAFLAFRGAGA